LRYHASVPLYAHGRRLGVLNVASTDWRELSDDDLRLLHTVGDLLGIAVERARLFEQSADLGAAEERNRLAREIHDTLAQQLAAIALQLETADALLERADQAEASATVPAVRQAVGRALALSRAGLQDARRSVLDLRAAPLEGRSLAEAIQDLVDVHRTAAGHRRIRFEAGGLSRPLPVRLEVGLYRIAQEALANVARHAQARHTELRLLGTPAQVTLEVADDGRGFDADQRPAGSFGLVGMTERARLMGGQLQITSRPGHGTRLSVVVPLGEAGSSAAVDAP
jgi:two-component system NarL family sensor kinase